MAKPCRRGLKVQRRRSGLTDFQRAVLAEAERLGLYVGFSQPWHIYDLRSGRTIGWFNFESKKYKAHDVRGFATGGWRQMLREVAELNRNVTANGAEVGDAELYRVHCKET